MLLSLIRLIYPWSLAKVMALAFSFLYLEVTLTSLPDFDQIQSTEARVRVLFHGSSSSPRDVKRDHLYLDTPDFISQYSIPPLEVSEPLRVLDGKLIHVEYAISKRRGVFTEKGSQRYVLSLKADDKTYLNRAYATEFYKTSNRDNLAKLFFISSLYVLLYLIAAPSKD